MQTFLPYEDFRRTAEALDSRRLGKQRVETLQIMRALTVPGYAWKNHPAVLMWKGYEEALCAYGRAICEVWRERGFNDTCEAKIIADAAVAGVTQVRTQDELRATGGLPPWIGDEKVHVSHQSSLVRKDPDHYRLQFPDAPDDLEYEWPVRVEKPVKPAAKKRAAKADKKAPAEAVGKTPAKKPAPARKPVTKVPESMAKAPSGRRRAS